MMFSQSKKLLLTTTVVAVIHHIDHYLRIDHSGWPFLPRVTPFTYSLLVYPIFLSIFLSRSKPWYRVTGTMILFLLATLSHIFFEPLSDKFYTWTYGSNIPHHIGEQNMLGYNSKILGIGSVMLAIFLSVLLFITLISFIKDARNKSNF